MSALGDLLGQRIIDKVDAYIAALPDPKYDNLIRETMMKAFADAWAGGTKRIVGANYVIENSDFHFVYDMQGGFSITLPLLTSSWGKIFVIRKYDAGAGIVTIKYSTGITFTTITTPGTTLCVYANVESLDWIILFGADTPLTLSYIQNPTTNWLASKTTGWTTDSFSGGLLVDFSASVPAGTKRVIIAYKLGALAAGAGQALFYWRKNGDADISNTPNASLEYANLGSFVNYGSSMTYSYGTLVVWLGADLKVQFAHVGGVTKELYISRPMEALV